MANSLRPLSAPPVYRDVFDSLAWPQLLKTWRFALRPANLIYAALLLFTLLLLARGLDAASALVKSDASPSLLKDVTNAFTFPPPRASLLDAATFRLGQLLQFISEHRAHLLILALPAGLVVALCAGAAARGTAEMWTQPTVRPWPTVLAMSIRKLVSSCAALLAPLVVCVFLLGLLSAAGFLLSVPVLQIAGGLLFFAVLLLAGVLTLLLCACVLTLPMMVPAVLIEGTDAIDAVQRCLAYAFAQPVRIVLYWLLLLAQGAAVVWVVSWLVKTTLALTAWAVSGLVNKDIASALSSCIINGAPNKAGIIDLGFTGSMLCFWSKLAQSLPSIAGLSFVLCAGTLLYGTMRRICDGQDASELFDPAAAARVEARTLASHARDEAAKKNSTEDDT